ncbi:MULTISPECIES: DUF6274 family protein [unclassified Streptomyces]|uniref:DUF6274 family protein n=1 Tax=unclassified Streptomyces TaxID=2593676 RepID=UPI0037F13187
MTVPAVHETRALLRAHLSAASSYRHLTRHCQVCLRLERLVLEAPPDEAERPAVRPSGAPRPETRPAPEPVPDANGRAPQAH